MNYRAVRPLDPDAVAAADAAVAPETGGRRLTMGPEDQQLRDKWMRAYVAAGGKVEPIKPKNRAPNGCTENCPLNKAVTGKIVSLTFRSDHLDSAGKKKLKKAVKAPVKIYTLTWNDAKKKSETQVEDYDSLFGDDFTEFSKPEWADARGGSADSHPISQTRDTLVKVDLEIDVTVTPDGQSAQLTEVRGKSGKGALNFQHPVSQTLKTQRITLKDVTAAIKLPAYVDGFKASIDWSLIVDGKKVPIGTTGEHRVYVTLDQPGGKLYSPVNNAFEDGGTEQVVTEPRLQYSVLAAQRKGASDEQECVDAIFIKLMKLGVGYVLGRRWENDVDNTGVSPKPSLHHYLWLCNSSKGQGECHNIAAAFAVACRMIGVKGSFKVGYMYPWPGRDNTPPSYPRSTIKSAGGNNILGKLNQRHTRSHASAGHGTESLVFLDGTDRANNFEGVAAYKGKALYAIGDDVFDKYPLADDNASCYFAQRQVRQTVDDPLRLPILNMNKGAFELVFSDTSTYTHCNEPYPGKSSRKFRWEE
jgi:hypothetical protein